MSTTSTKPHELDAPADPPFPSRIWAWLPAPYNPVGLSVAVLFVCLSLTPSLLPRGPAFQGWLCGIDAAAGYGLGVLLCRIIARLIAWRPGPVLRRLSHVVVGVGGTVAVVVFLVATRGWQRQAHQLVGQQVPGPGSPLLILTLMLLAFVVLVGACRLGRKVTRALSGHLSRWLPVALASLASVVLVFLAAGTIVDQVLLRVALACVDRVASAANDEIPAGVTQPTSPQRSGSPASLVSWDDLGYEGRAFVTGGPSVAKLSRFAGTPAKTPIRAYVGLRSAADARGRAVLAVAELQRAGAFDRKVLCVLTTTGTGWVDEPSASALEYLYGGDSAIVATQYSYLPSSLSFVFDNDQVETEGAELFTQIHQRWASLPTDHRPRLVIYGESLGSNGGQAAFKDLDQMRRNVDGALFVGPPSSNHLRQTLTAQRDPGSPERLPTDQDGAAVRFAADEGTLARPLGRAWQAPRVLFLQHASDPVVWWSPKLLLRRPQWLTQRRGHDVSPAMSWYPIVTFWQVTADLTAANHVPAGAGHRYGDLVAEGWAAVLPPEGWTGQDTLRLTQVIP